MKTFEHPESTKKAVEATFNKLMAMPAEEFDRLMEEHRDGDIGKLILYGLTQKEPLEDVEVKG
jgi:hypothetical protein